MQSNASNSTDIDIGENGDSGDVDLNERKIEFYVNHKRFGRLWLGQGDTASNGTSEVDLSGTTVVTYSSIEDMAGGFNFRDDNDNVITSIGSAFSKAELTDILLYHVLDSAVTADEAKASTGDIVMANGKLAGLKYFDGDLYINDDAQVIIPNIMTSNGVIHVVDTVILGPWHK